MKKFLAFFSAMIFSLVVFAQKGPNMDFKDPNNTFDFGTVKAGEKVSHVFEFKNTGDQAILIQKVESSCGCTSPDWTKAPILPGNSGKITVTYDSTDRVGPFDKSVFVKTNFGKPIELKILGTAK